MNISVVTMGRTDTDYVAALEGLHGPVTVVRRCTELAELVAVCQGGLAGAALIVGDSSGVTASLLERLAHAEVALLVLVDATGERRRLAELGADTAGTAVSAEDLAELLGAAVRRLGAVRPPASARGKGTPARTEVHPGGPAPAAAPEPPPAGSITAVWGPTGAPGRSTVAVNLAVEAALGGRRVLLVDADTYGASVASLLGLLDESAGLAQACRLADQGVLEPAGIDRLSATVVVNGAPLRVLTGITRADRWAEVRPAALQKVLRTAAGTVDLLVIDCGFCLEADDDSGFDSLGPRRNGATLISLEAADRVLAVGAADAVSIPRLIRALAELQEAVPTAAAEIVINKVRRGALGRAPHQQLREAWVRFGPVPAITAFLPADQTAADAALLGGSALAEAAPDSPLRHAIAALAGRPAAPRRGLFGRRTPAGVKFT